MSQRSAGTAPQVYEQDGEQQSQSVESQRLVSEDNSHYILIKGAGSYDLPGNHQLTVPGLSLECIKTLINLSFFQVSRFKTKCTIVGVYWLFDKNAQKHMQN